MNKDLFGRPSQPETAAPISSIESLEWPVWRRSLGPTPTKLHLIHYELLLDNRVPVTVTRDSFPFFDWHDIRNLHPSYVRLEVVGYKFIARATDAGYRAARAWFKTKSYNFRPGSKDLGKLMRNFNKFVAEETDWEPTTDRQVFRDMCIRNEQFRSRWAPNKDFSNYMP